MHYKDFMSWSLHDCVKSKDRTDLLVLGRQPHWQKIGIYVFEAKHC